MEDYEAQEVEFWAKLEEEGMSRSSMLRRSAAAACGLTIMGSASTACGMSRAALATPPTRNAGRGAEAGDHRRSSSCARGARTATTRHPRRKGSRDHPTSFPDGHHRDRLKWGSLP